MSSGSKNSNQNPFMEWMNSLQNMEMFNDKGNPFSNMQNTNLFDWDSISAMNELNTNCLKKVMETYRQGTQSIINSSTNKAADMQKMSENMKKMFEHAHDPEAQSEDFCKLMQQMAKTSLDETESEMQKLFKMNMEAFHQMKENVYKNLDEVSKVSKKRKAA